MVTVGVARLKASLSAYLARVKAGDEIVVTERGRPIARLVPMGPAKTASDGHLAALESAGIARRGRGGLASVLDGLPRPDDPDGLLLDALLAEREAGR